RVTGHQWWWQVDYVGQGEARTFTKANEIHIPVGRPVRVELEAADVIHSFWVPALTGKTDTIPGQHNVTWMQADKAGIYRGQCTEYCGQQHAHIGFLVIAEPQQQFDTCGPVSSRGRKHRGMKSPCGRRKAASGCSCNTVP